MTTNWKLLGRIFVSFMKIGPVTFGGGFAMIPLIEREIVDRRHWIEDKELSEMLAVCQSVPGAIGANTATCIGYRLAGITGAIAALLGILLPTFLFVLGLCLAFTQFRDQPKIEAAFQGIRPAVVALIVYAAIKLSHTSIIDKATAGTVIVSVVLLLLVKLHPVLVILLGAAAGIVLSNLKLRLGYGDVTKDNEPVNGYMFGDGI